MASILTILRHSWTYMLCACVFVVIGMVLYAYLFASVESAVAKYPLIDISRHFVPQEDFIVNVQPLRDALEKLTQEFGEESISLYVEFLNTGANISINKDNYIWPASLSKLPLALAVMKKIERGEWKLSNELVLLTEDRDIKSGDRTDPLVEFPIGTRFTIEQLLEELLVNSDNTAFKILLRNLHSDEIEVVIDELGLNDLFKPDGRISAKEYSRILRALYASSFLTREHSQQILTWLDQSPFDSFLSSGIPADVPFPHKYGENITTMIFADSGIVYLPHRPYLISVMVQGDSKHDPDAEAARAEVFMKAVSEAVYTYFSGYTKTI